MIQLIVMFGLTLLAFSVVIGLMAVGVMLGRGAIRGSCGGVAGGQGQEGSGGCSLCSEPASTCREQARQDLARREQAEELHNHADSVPDCHDQCEAKGCTSEAIQACHNSRAASAGAVAQSRQSC